MRVGWLWLAWLFLAPGICAAGQKTSLEFATGYRVDNLQWNIASDLSGTMSPNVLSELTWRNLNIFQVQARAHAENEYGIYTKAMVGYGWILSGSNQDSDYGGDNRSLEWSRSNNDASLGSVLDGSFGMGYHFRLGKEENASLIPLIGISYDAQRLSMTNGNQTVSACAPSPPFLPGTCGAPLGPFIGLDSSYNAEWVGPWAGLDSKFKYRRFQFGAGAEYHWNVTYNGWANWNLRPDLRHPQSFTHRAKGSGVTANGGISYELTERWFLRAMGEWRDWSTDLGVDHSYSFVVSDTRLNRVSWTSASGSFSVGYLF